ncbi:MAG TPA: ABC transporter substrate-binding protein [Terriglobales bacterium]|nr:ABC transporter substrate-binding protein [Terriglobales bacterium]
MWRIPRWQLLSASIMFFALTPKPAFAVTPTEQLQGTIQQVLSIVSSTADARDERRKAQLQETLMPRFDWAAMAKQTLGKHWESVPNRHDEFVSAFAEFLGNAYIGKIAEYRDEKILFVEETIENDSALVKTKILSGKGEVTSVNYQLHRVGGEWKIYDVVMEDVSLVVNFRSQFNRILARGSFDDLLKQMRDKELRNRN